MKTKKEENIKITEKEGVKTRKIREKLRKYFEQIDKEITPQALKIKSMEIHRWINRYASKRIILKDKISLFDENKNTANLSKKVSKLMEKLNY